MFDAVLEANAERWTRETELAAEALEVAHAHMTLFIAANSGKKRKLPEPLVVERPDRLKPKDEKPTPVSISQLRAIAGKDGG